MRKKASITVFAALSLMLVAQLLFTLLEAARHYELQKVLYMNTDTVLESVFADYCSPLWETYKILGVRVEDTKVNYVLITGKHSYVALHRIILEAKSRKLCFLG